MTPFDPDVPRWRDRDVERLVGALTGWSQDDARDLLAKWEGHESKCEEGDER